MQFSSVIKFFIQKDSKIFDLIKSSNFKDTPLRSLLLECQEFYEVIISRLNKYIELTSLKLTGAKIFLFGINITLGSFCYFS